MVTQCAFFLHRNPENVQKDHHHHLHEWPRLLDHRSFGSAAAYHDRRQTPFIGSTTCCSVLVFGFSLIVTILNSQRTVRYENRWQKASPCESL